MSVLSPLRESDPLVVGVDGARIGSTQLTFEPGPVRAGDYRFAVGTAGSTMLVLQCILPALLIADGPSTVVIEGGTHNGLWTDEGTRERMGGAVSSFLRRIGHEHSNPSESDG